MKNLFAKVFALILPVLCSSAAVAGDSRTEAAVRAESKKFVEAFNQQDVRRLGTFYRFDGSLKLPDVPSVNGRRAVRQAWQGGFDAGLSLLKLTITNLDDVGFNKVVESGTYELEINTPNGKLLQTGTYSVQWCYHRFHGRITTPKISFDTIDAKETK